MNLTVGMVDKEENSPSVASDLRSPELPSAGKQLFFSVLRALFIFLISLIWFGAFAPLGLDFHHDGVMFIPALRVAAGQTVFRDVFCQYGLLSPLLQGGAVWLGGGELLAMKYLSVLFYAAIGVLLDFLWRPLLSARWRNLILLMFWVLMPDTMVTFHAWSSIFALFFSLLALLFILKFFDGKRWYFAGAAGVAAGLTFLARHPVGVVTLLALLIALFFEIMLDLPGKPRARRLIRNCVWVACGMLVTVVSAGIYLFCTGAWHDFVLQCWKFVLNFVHGRGGRGSWSYFAESLFPFTTDLGLWDSIFGLLPIAAMVWLFIGVRRAAADKSVLKENLMICTLSIFALGAWHQYYPVPCVRHLFWAGVPFFGFWVLSFQKLWFAKECYRAVCRMAALLLVIVFLAAGFIRINAAVNRLIESPRRAVAAVPGIRGMKLTTAENRMISGVRSLFDSLPEHIRKRGVLNCTTDGLWSVLLPESDFSHPQFIWMKETVYPDYDVKLDRYIRQFRPVVLYNKPLYLENYFPAAAWQYMGEIYTFAVPLE
ncbi:MAG: hypothetical protein E7042_04430 [Lentisphaerae bacterium]|nr:hypothetical protein [Lentisphaerota bacterium]